MVRGEVGVRRGQGLFGDRTSGVVGLEYPVLDALPVVGYAGYRGHRVFHDLERNGTDEVLRNFNIFH